MIWITQTLFESVVPKTKSKEVGVDIIPTSFGDFGGNIIVVNNKLPVITQTLLTNALDAGSGITMLYPTQSLVMDGIDLLQYFKVSVDKANAFGIPSAQFVYVTHTDWLRELTLDRQLVPMFAGSPGVNVPSDAHIIPLCRRVEFALQTGASTKGRVDIVSSIVLNSLDIDNLNKKIGDRLKNGKT